MVNDHNTHDPLKNLIGESGPFQQVIESIKQVAPTNITVLITGESGTGKEMIARAIHEMSPRRDKPLLTVNCGAIPEGILESELFGHEKGAFTGAIDSRNGYFEIADRGVLFLDEIGEMPLMTQVKLLRALEEKEFIRVGGTKIIKVDVRVLAATNRNLESAVQRGEFRKDLFYRLNAVNINVPPLRKRKEDIRPLTIHFAREICTTNNIEYHDFAEDAFELLESHSWPGNIRELRNLIERVLILEKGKKINRTIIEAHISRKNEFERNLPMITHKTSDQAERELIYRALIDLRMAVEEIRSLVLNQPVSTIQKDRFGSPVPADFAPEKDSNNTPDSLSIKEMEKSQIEKAMEKYKGNRRKAAKALGIGERTLYRKIKEYHIESP